MHTHKSPNLECICLAVLWATHFPARSLNDAKCSLNGAECSLNDAECSLNDAECSLNDAECPLNDAECYLNDAECSHVQVTLGMDSVMGTQEQTDGALRPFEQPNVP